MTDDDGAWPAISSILDMLGESAQLRKRVGKSRITHNWPHRRARPALGRGRCQLGAMRAALSLGDALSTRDAALWVYPNKILMRGEQLRPHHYRRIRQALSRIAVPIGRGDGRGRPMQWLIVRERL
jgi:hypothetical protein